MSDRKAFRSADGSPRWNLAEIVVTGVIGLLVAAISGFGSSWVSAQVFRGSADLKFSQLEKRLERLDRRVDGAERDGKERTAELQSQVTEIVRDLKTEIRDLRKELREMPSRLRDLLKKE